MVEKINLSNYNFVTVRLIDPEVGIGLKLEVLPIAKYPDVGTKIITVLEPELIP